MKRHQVMDLFYGNMTEEVGDWHKIEDASPKCKGKGTKVKVKLDNLTELYAYFYEDKCVWIESHGQKPAYFWDCNTRDPLHNVTHWKSLKETRS